MKRRFNHNARVIQELYGRNFSLESLLNEQDNNSEENKLGDKVKNRIKQSIKTVFAGKDKSISDSDIVQKGLINIAIQKGSITDDSSDEEIAAAVVDNSDEIVQAAEKNEPANKEAGGGEEKKNVDREIPSGKTEQIKKLQDIIGVEQTGKWDTATNEGWKTWIVSSDVRASIDANKSKLNDKGLDPEYLETNKGSAATIAKKAGYAGTLSGVLEFAIELSANMTSEQPDTGENDQEPDTGESKQVDSWTSLRPGKDDVESTINELHDNYPEVYDAPTILNGVQGDVNVFKALSQKGVCPGLSTVFVRPSSEFKKELPSKTIGISKVSTMASGDENLVTYTGSKAGANNAVFYDESKKEIIYDSASGYSNFIISGIHLTDDKKFLYAKSGSTNESRTTLAGKMILGESRADLYRKRYWGRY